MKGSEPISATQKIQREDYADHLYASGLIYRAIEYPTKRHRDFADAIQSVNSGRGGIFKRPHLTMARICQHTGGKAGAEAFVRREIEVIERFAQKTGHQPFKVTRGGGIEHEVTSYEDFISPAANWLVQAARDDKAAWKASRRAAMQKYVAEAMKLIPRITAEAEPDQNSMPIDDAQYIERMITQGINYALKACERAAENGGDAVGVARMAAERLLRYAENQHHSRRAFAITPEVGRVTKLLPSPAENKVKQEEKPNILEAALDYARRSIPVFPVKQNKAPYTPHGFKDATCDEATIREWWDRWPDANIGVPTGTPSGWLVLDSDPRHGGDASLCELIEQYEELPETREAETGGGGHHVIFEYPELAQLGNARGRLPEGLDVRGEGGYIIAAPSLHASGRRYRWRNELEPAPVPDWLLKLLTEERSSAALSGEKPHSEAKSGATVGNLITEGSRNDRLFRIACAMRGQGYGPEEIEAGLSEINTRRCSPPLSVGEVLKIVKSAANYSPNSIAVGA